MVSPYFTEYGPVGRKDFDDIFELAGGNAPGGSTGFTIAGGGDLAARYARLSAGQPLEYNVGFIALDGRDLQQWFAKKGTVPAGANLVIPMGFSGVIYSDTGVGGEGYSKLLLLADGTWQVSGSGGTVTHSGDWLTPIGAGLGSTWYGRVTNITANSQSSYPAGIFKFDVNRAFDCSGTFSLNGSLYCDLQFSKQSDMSVIEYTAQIRLLASYGE